MSPLPWCGCVKTFIQDLDEISVGDSTGYRQQAQAGKSEESLIKGLFTHGHAIKELMRACAESWHWSPRVKTEEHVEGSCPVRVRVSVPQPCAADLLLCPCSGDPADTYPSSMHFLHHLCRGLWKLFAPLYISCFCLIYCL